MSPPQSSSVVFSFIPDPDFVSSLEDDDHVYFFFRESAVEYMNCGKVILNKEFFKDTISRESLNLKNLLRIGRLLSQMVKCALQRQIFFFAKQFIHFIKRDTKTVQKTNHYILLTNVSIKRCIKTSFETGFIRGGEEFQPDKYLTDSRVFYPSQMYSYNVILQRQI